MKTVAVIQARLGSTRLPGKVLFLLGGRPVLEWAVRACRAAPGVDEVWVATSTLPADNQIADWCRVNKIKVCRGSETDVLSRFVGASEQSKADILLRLTADCPFLDPQVIGAVVRLQKQTGAAYCSNVSPRTYPDGLDVQCFTREALMAAHKEATRPIDRDGVCTWIERNRSRFPAETVINPLPGLESERWVMDTPADYEFAKKIVELWPWEKGPPSQLDMLGILDKHPQLRDINGHHPCNERYYDALAEEPIYGRSYERSQAQLTRARKVIPLGAQTFSKSYLQYPQPSPLFVTHGQGGEVWDVDGNSYIDLVSALLPNILGYRDPEVDHAIRRQLSSGISFSVATELEAELAETLVRLIPCAEMVRFGKNGSDVTSAAVRLARAYTKGDLVFSHGYHGWHDWTVVNTDRGNGIPYWWETYSGLEQIKAGEVPDVLPRSTAAVIIEPDGWSTNALQEFRKLCDRCDSLLIFDEVITGFRFDLGGAQKLYGVTPDLACFGKAMANGMPLSAVVGRRDIMKLMEPPDNIFYSGTFFGEALSLAAAIATIKKLERDNVIPKLWWTGAYLADEAKKLISNHGLRDVITFFGEPPLIRLKFRDDQIAALFRREMVWSGTLITNSHNICAAHGPSEIRRVLKSYDHTLAIIADALKKGDIAHRLDGAMVGQAVRT